MQSSGNFEGFDLQNRKALRHKVIPEHTQKSLLFLVEFNEIIWTQTLNELFSSPGTGFGNFATSINTHNSKLGLLFGVCCDTPLPMAFDLFKYFSRNCMSRKTCGSIASRIFYISSISLVPEKEKFKLNF